MIRRISTRAIVLHEGKLLCVKQRPKGSNTNAESAHWNLPGGGLDESESLQACLRREMVEETGVYPNIGNLMYIQQFSYDGIEYLEFFFHVSNAADYLNIDLSATTHGQAEIAKIAFIDPARSNILPVFLQTEPLSERIQAPAKIYSL